MHQLQQEQHRCECAITTLTAWVTTQISIMFKHISMR